MPPRGRAVLSGLAVALLFLLPLVPEAIGRRRLVFRDAHITHWPWRQVALRSLNSGEAPFINENASGGQPLLANPNAVLLYPTFLLAGRLPEAAAFNLHYLLHTLWAFFGARALARRLRLPSGPAFLAAVAYGFSGMMLSYASAFANSAVAAAWLPWCAAAAVDIARARGGRSTVRAAAAAGLAFGLQALGGEPAISLLTAIFCGALALAVHLSEPGFAPALLTGFAAAWVGAGALALGLAAPLLLPLADVLSMTYRGQHLYSERAFGASPFSTWRAVEWLFPRFSGDPGAIGPGGHWQFALHQGDFVYIWCVTLGVIPLVLLTCAATRRDFWKGLPGWLGAFGGVCLLFAFGTSLPLFRLLFQIDALRRLRYPIKFYLLTTLCAAMLAGFAAQRLGERPAGKRERVLLVGFALIFVAALLAARPGAALDAVVAPRLAQLPWPQADLLAAIRGSFSGDAGLGLLCVALVAAALLWPRPAAIRFHLLGFAALLLALPWGLPLFVAADDRDLLRPPALGARLVGSGRLYVDPAGPRDDALPSRAARLARIQIERLVPATGASFGVRSLFDQDPDGSYGWFNRLAGEALSVSSPEERSRLLQTYGARWALAEESADYPGFTPVTGISIAGRRLTLHEIAQPLPEVRWASRELIVRSLSGALDLIRSSAFHPETDVVLPGRADRFPAEPGANARVAATEVRADRASADVEAAVAGHLLFSRTYFPSWKATLDGRPAPVLVANARELAVAVPAGRHSVTFAWDRAPFVRGVFLQFSALLAVVALVASSSRPVTAQAQKP